MAHRALAAVAATLAAAAMAACGDAPADDTKSDREQLESVMDGFRAALSERDGEAGCALFAASLKRQFGAAAPGGPGEQDAPAGCVAGFEALAAAPVTEDLTPKILAVRVQGDRAQVVGFVSHDQERQTARFVREDGEWRIVEWFRSRG